MDRQEHRIERRLAAIFAADVAGYSRLMSQDEVGTLRTLTAHRRTMDSLIVQHRGRIANTAGDSVLAEFPSAVDAVQCAVEIQEALRRANDAFPPERRLAFRIGVHVGDVMVQGTDLLGDTVNIAARLQALAYPGGICLSDAAQQYVRKALPLRLEDLGPRTIKNMEESIRVFSVKSVEEEEIPVQGQSRLFVLPDKPSLAVLPFGNLSGDPEQEYFADGVVEDIITALSRVRWLFVIARNSSFTYKGRAVDVKQIGRELGVRYVLEGSVRRSGDRIRISGQLVDATTGSHLWADRFDGSVQDIFALQDEVAASVAGVIEPRLQSAEIERVVRKPTESLDAYDCMLRALPLTYAFTCRDLEEALVLLHRAIQIDGSYASAHGWAAWCYVLRRLQSCPQGTWDEDAAEAMRLARAAAAVGKDDPLALWTAGLVFAYHGRDLETGLALIDRALALNPNSAQAWVVSGWGRCYADLPETALVHFSRAHRLDPFGPFTALYKSGCALCYYLMDQYEAAIPWAQEAIRDTPTYVGPYRILAVCCALSGRQEDAAKAVRQYLALAPSASVAETRKGVPWKNEKKVEVFLDALRGAGLPD